MSYKDTINSNTSINRNLPININEPPPLLLLVPSITTKPTQPIESANPLTQSCLDVTPSPTTKSSTPITIIPSPTSSKSLYNLLVFPSITSSTTPNLKIHKTITRKQTGSLKPRLIFYLNHSTTALDEPQSHTATLADPNWTFVMNEEFLTLLSQNTLTLIQCQSGVNVLGCKWMFTKKLKSDGSLAHYKARLVAQGYKQLEGVNYYETFNLVSKLTIVQILITITAYK